MRLFLIENVYIYNYNAMVKYNVVPAFLLLGSNFGRGNTKFLI